MTFAMIPGKDVHFRPGANNEGDVMGWAPPQPGSNGPLIDSVLKAWDPLSGKLVWQTAPMAFWGGGGLSTAAGLVVQGSAAGAFTAYQANSGRKLAIIDTA